MADIHTTAPRAGLLTRIIANAGHFLISIGENNCRVREADRLRALSDEELSRKGLRREDITRHVFRDMFYI